MANFAPFGMTGLFAPTPTAAAAPAVRTFSADEAKALDVEDGKPTMQLQVEGTRSLRLLDGRTVMVQALREPHGVVTFFHATSSQAAASIVRDGNLSVPKHDDGRGHRAMGCGLYFCRYRADTYNKSLGGCEVFLRVQVRLDDPILLLPRCLLRLVRREDALAAGFCAAFGAAAPIGMSPEAFPFSKDEWVVYEPERVLRMTIEAADTQLRTDQLPGWAQSLYKSGAATLDLGLHAAATPMAQASSTTQCRHQASWPCLLCDLERGMPFSTAFDGFGLSPVPSTAAAVEGPSQLVVRGRRQRDDVVVASKLPFGVTPTAV